MEDFNCLLRCEQVELIRAQTARTEAEKDRHRAEARSFARLIEAHAFPYRSVDDSGQRLFDAHTYDAGFATTH